MGEFLCRCSCVVIVCGCAYRAKIKAQVKNAFFVTNCYGGGINWIPLRHLKIIIQKRDFNILFEILLFL